MKKLVSVILLLSFIFCLTSCGEDNNNDMVEKAVKGLENTWIGNYYGNEIQDWHFEIKNTRIIKIKETDIEEFKDVDYIIEFVLFTNYYNSSPYYSSVGMYDSVTVYSNGEMEVPKTNLLKYYTMSHYSSDYSDIIGSIDDCGAKYNRSKKLK